jgi:hypothetical protein
VKIGSWSEKEQIQIFEEMKNHLTSWSTISRKLMGRTENSIKNYFYSTVRRIQACPVIEFISKLKKKEPAAQFASEEEFEKSFELDKLNLLGTIICKWLYNPGEARETHFSLYNYLLNMITDDKKKQKPKDSKDSKDSEDAEIEERTAVRDREQHEPILAVPSVLRYYNPKTLNGTSLLLPLALHGDLANITSRSIFERLQSQQGPRPDQTFLPPGSHNLRSQKATSVFDDSESSFSNISIPIPSSGSFKKVNLAPNNTQGMNPTMQDSGNSSNPLNSFFVNQLLWRLSSLLEHDVEGISQDKNNTQALTNLIRSFSAQNIARNQPSSSEVGFKEVSKANVCIGCLLRGPCKCSELNLS